MEEEEIVVGAQWLGRALKALGVLLAAALALAVHWLWRRFA